MTVVIMAQSNSNERYITKEETNLINELNKLVPAGRWNQWRQTSEREDAFLSAMFQLQELKRQQQALLVVSKQKYWNEKKTAIEKYLATKSQTLSSLSGWVSLSRGALSSGRDFWRKEENKVAFNDKETAKAVIMTYLSQYLRNERPWQDVQNIVELNKKWIDEGSDTHTYITEITKLHNDHNTFEFENPGAKAIIKTIDAQITAYITKHDKGDTNSATRKAKIEVMQALQQFLVDKDWTKVETALDKHRGLYDAGLLYSQVKETVQEVKMLKDKLWTVKKRAPVQTNFDEFKNRMQRDLSIYREKHRKEYASIEGVEFDNLTTINQRYAFHKKEVLTAIDQYLEGEIPWTTVCREMERNPNWNESTFGSSLQSFVAQIEQQIPDAKAARKTYDELTAIEHKMNKEPQGSHLKNFANTIAILKDNPTKELSSTLLVRDKPKTRIPFLANEKNKITQVILDFEKQQAYNPFAPSSPSMELKV